MKLKGKLVNDVLKSTPGRQALAAAMAAPIRGHLSQLSLGRRIFSQPVDVCTKCGAEFWEAGDIALHTEDECLVQAIMDR